MNYRIADLCYRILDGEVRLAPLRVLATRGADWRGWRVTFHVLGASHAVCLERDGIRLTELLTCAPPDGASQALAQCAAANASRLTLCAHGLRCRVTLSLFDLSEGTRLQGDFPAENRLERVYPLPSVLAESAGAPPCTRIGWTCQGDGIIVETVHTYPEEGRGVRSLTLFCGEEAA